MAFNFYERYKKNRAKRKYNIALYEAKRRIKIRDYDNEIAFCVDGIKVKTIKFDKEDVDTLNRMRSDFISKYLKGEDY